MKLRYRAAEARFIWAGFAGLMIMVTWGVIMVLVSVAIFAQQEWGRWVGIIATTVSILLAFFWIFAFPRTTWRDLHRRDRRLRLVHPSR